MLEIWNRDPKRSVVYQAQCVGLHPWHLYTMCGHRPVVVLNAAFVFECWGNRNNCIYCWPAERAEEVKASEVRLTVQERRTKTVSVPESPPPLSLCKQIAQWSNFRIKWRVSNDDNDIRTCTWKRGYTHLPLCEGVSISSNNNTPNHLLHFLLLSTHKI